ncbi:PP2C family protein-serine/threonine phosphatase [Singulisphaera sp. PoT]|uniref:PP2C family protein-serine/threonine phosphatase n=1 Tax=Singulisphaera sp. PoT TaxID=3411797 RepID=UPI003BF55247
MKSAKNPATTSAAHAEHPAPRVMKCMEIQGGSNAVEEPVSTPGLEGWIYSLPHQGAERGGDVHYLSLCGGGLFTRLIVADVSGHGAKVAEFSAWLRTAMRRNINRKSQTGLVREINRQFSEMAQSRRFATAVIATYLSSRRRLTLCNAGHPRPLWFHAGTGQWSIMTREDNGAGNLPLGIDDDASYHQFAVDLERGDIVAVYTDALSEAASPDGRMLGEEGLLQLARGLEGDDPQELGKALLARIGEHRGGLPSDDDVTLVVFFHTGSGPRRLSVAEKLDVLAKVFRLKPS